MAVVRHAVGTAASGTTTSVAPTIPTNSVGDILLLSVVSSGTVTTPAGWTLIGSIATQATANTLVYWRQVVTVLSGTVTVTTSTSNTRAVIASYTGAAQSPPTLITTASGSGTAVTAPSQTYDSYIVWVNGRAASSTLSAEASSSLLDWLPAEAYDTAGTPSLTVTDGLVSTGTVTSLTGTSSVTSAWGSVAVGLVAANVVASESFTGTTGAAWPAQWTAGATAGTATIQSNAGQQNLAVAIGTGSRRMDLNGSGAIAQDDELDITVSGTFSAQSSFAAVGWGDATGTDARPANGWEAVFNAASTASGSHISIGQMINGVETLLATNVTVTLTAGTQYRFRVQKTGSTVRAKFWTASAAEPTAWNITGSISNAAALPTSGYVSLGSFQGDTTSRNVTYDDLIVASPTIGTDPRFISMSQGRTPVGAATSASASVTAPANIVAGNVLVAFAYNAKGGVTANVTGPAGWTRAGQLDTTTIGVMAVFYKVATASEPASYSFTNTYTSSQNQFLIVTVHNYAGVDTTTPISGGPTFTPYGTATASPAAPSITPNTDRGTEIVGWGSFNGKAITAEPTGFNQRSAWVNDLNMSLTTGDKFLSAAANTATGTATPTAVSDNWIAGSVVLNPVQPVVDPTLPARVQFGVANSAYNGTATTTSLSVSLPAPATAGNLLVAAWSIDKVGGAFFPPAGWTEVIQRSGTSISLYVFYKIASGGEQAIPGSWAAASLGASALVAEYTNPNAGSPFGPNDLSLYNGDGSETARTSVSFAPANPTSDGLAIMLMGIDTVNTSGGFNPSASGYTLVSSSTTTVGSGSPGLALSERTVSSGVANTPTFTWTDSDQVNGVLLQMQKAGSSTAYTSSGSSAGAGTTTATNSAGFNSSGSSSGSGTITATVTSAFFVAPVNTGAGQTTATVLVGAVTSGTASGSGSGSATDFAGFRSTGSGTGTGTTSGTDLAALRSTGSSAGNGATSASSTTASFISSGSSTGTGTTSATDAAADNTSGSSSGNGSLTATVSAAFKSTGSSSGTGSTSATDFESLSTSGSSTGTGTTTASVVAAFASSGSSTGSGTTSGSVTAAFNTTGTAAGNGTGSSTDSWGQFTTGSSTGTGSTTASTGSALTTSGSSSGVGSTSASVSEGFAIAGSSSGTGSGTATVVAHFVTAGSGSGNGSGTSTDRLQAVTSGSGTGTGTTSATDIENASVEGSSAGNGSLGATTTAALGTSSAPLSGLGSTTATDQAAFNAAGSASGLGTTFGTDLAGLHTDGDGSGDGTTAGTASAGLHVTADGSGEGSGTASAVASSGSVAAVTGNGLSTATVTAAFNSSGSSQGTGILSASDGEGLSAIASSTATGSSTATTSVGWQVTADLVAHGLTSASGSGNQTANADLVGSGSTSADTRVGYPVRAAATGSGSLDTDVQAGYRTSGSSAGLGILVALDGEGIFVLAASLGTGSGRATTSVGWDVTAALHGNGRTTARAEVVSLFTNMAPAIQRIDGSHIRANAEIDTVEARLLDSPMVIQARLSSVRVSADIHPNPIGADI